MIGLEIPYQAQLFNCGMYTFITSYSTFHLGATRVKLRLYGSVLARVVLKFHLPSRETRLQYVVFIKTLKPAGIIYLGLLDRSDIHVLPTKEIFHYLVGLTSETIVVKVENFNGNV